MNGYLQHFTVNRLEVQNRRVVLNGIEISSERSAAMVDTRSIHWTNGNSIQVVAIGSAAEARQEIPSILMSGPSGPSTLILMRRDQDFRRWADVLSASLTTLDLSTGRAVVMVRTDEAQITSYEVEVEASVEELPLTNVVGLIPGRRADEIVLFGAHYDGVGTVDPLDGDSIVNGANDGASGPTTVIELARYFKARGRPERTLTFAAVTAEHVEYLGARYLSQHLDPTQIVAMFSIAAVGKVDPRGSNTAYVTGFDRSDFGTILQHAVEGSPHTFYPDPYERQALFRRSSNAPFACLAVPAHAIGTISMDPRDEDIHRVTDEVGTLDLSNMTNVIRAIALAASPIVSGEATPTRLDPPLQGYPCGG